MVIPAVDPAKVDWIVEQFCNIEAEITRVQGRHIVGTFIKWECQMICFIHATMLRLQMTSQKIPRCGGLVRNLTLLHNLV